ncbi:MAG: OmpH family outer membrane protein [Acidobacteriota bacterium]|jgi:outer membrane protein|nr:OmpH family outer membrane protein [Acidobacteriota bacterium]
MNRIAPVVIVIAMSLSAAFAQATASAPAPTGKVGWINVEQAILTTDEGAKALADIQKYVETKNAELNALRQEVDDLAKKLEVQGSKLTDEARMDLEEKATEKQTQLERFQTDTQREIDNRRNRLTSTISKKMGPVIEKVAIAKGLDAIEIFNANRDAWVNPALNVTEDLVKAYNQAYPASAPAVPAAAKQ